MMSDALECGDVGAPPCEAASPVSVSGFPIGLPKRRPQRLATSGCKQDLQPESLPQQHGEGAAAAATKTGMSLSDHTGSGTAIKGSHGNGPHAGGPNPFRGDSAHSDWQHHATSAFAVVTPAAAGAPRPAGISQAAHQASDRSVTAAVITTTPGTGNGDPICGGGSSASAEPQSPRLEAIDAFVRLRSTARAASLPPGTCRTGSLCQLRASSAGGRGGSARSLDAQLPSGSIKSASGSAAGGQQSGAALGNWLRTGSAGSRGVPYPQGDGESAVRSISLRLRRAACHSARRLAGLSARGSLGLGRSSSSGGGGTGGGAASASGGADAACRCQDVVQLAMPAPLHLFKLEPPTKEGAGSARAAQELLPPGHRYQHVLGLRSRFSSGAVDVCLDTESGDPVAIRFLAGGLAADGASVRRQLAFHQRAAGHPHIVQLLDVFALPGRLALVMQWANCGSLRDYTTAYMQDNGTGIPETDARRVMQQLLNAVQFAHDNGCATSSIKLDDVLLHTNPDSPGDVTVKLLCGWAGGGDGASSSSNVQAPGSLPKYYAPEALHCRTYEARHAAAWCCGVIMYMLLAGAFPFLTAREARLSPLARLHIKVQRILGGRFLVPARSVTPACSNLLVRLLDPDPDLRISLDEALQHPWIAAHPAAAHPQVLQPLPDASVRIPANWSAAVEALHM